MVLCPPQPQSLIKNLQHTVCQWHLGERVKEDGQSMRAKWARKGEAGPELKVQLGVGTVVSQARL